MSAERLDRLGLAFALTAAALVAGCSSSPATGVCPGVENCRVVAHTDVNGDGRPDAVAFVRAGGGAQQRGSLTLRVEVSKDRVVSTRLPLENWTGPVWQGAATLDAVPGKDLMVGRQMGASAQFYQSVTWRGGRLVVLDAPGPDRWWGVGRSATVLGGWQRTTSDPGGLVRWRVATSVGPGKMRGRIATYRWQAGGWHRTGVRTVAQMSQATASRWAGFQVPGLARY